MFALLFPGQGSQRPGMGLPWRDHRSWTVVDRIAAATGRDLGLLLTEADAETLKATRNAQLAAFGLSMVILDAAREAGLVAPTAAAGHSLGEYSALVAAGVLSLEEGARLVAARGEAMQAAVEQLPGTMAAVLGLALDGVADACAAVEGAWVANDNAPGQVVVAGTTEGVQAASEAAMAAGAKRVMPLAVGGAFHSPLMAPAQEPLDAALAAATFSPAAFPVVTNLDAAAHTDGWRPLLSGQLASPVCWRPSLLALSDLGVKHFVELGSGSELSGMVKRTVEGAVRTNVATPESLPGALPEA